MRKLYGLMNTSEIVPKGLEHLWYSPAMYWAITLIFGIVLGIVLVLGILGLATWVAFQMGLVDEKKARATALFGRQKGGNGGATGCGFWYSD